MIGAAVQNGSNVNVYNESGAHIFTRPAGSGPKDGLQGYTSTSVSIRIGSEIRIYNEHGAHLRSLSAR